MSLLIDGYNLLNAVGITGRGPAASSLERSRRALLDFLADSLPPNEIAATIVVFDSHDAPRGLPRMLVHRGLTVRFAAQYDDADAMLEELIRADTTPRRMTVVSSDHRIQRAARRRRARAVDSEVWFEEVIHRRHQTAAPVPKHNPLARPDSGPLLEEEVERWLRQFGGEPLLTRLAEEDQTGQGSASPRRQNRHDRGAEKTADQARLDIDNPFPPGYGEDLESES